MGRVLQSVAVYCSLLQADAGCCRLLQSVAGCCRLLQAVAIYCSLLHSVAACCNPLREHVMGRYRVAKTHRIILSCRSFSTKEPLNIVHFGGKWPIKKRDPMSLRHPVCVDLVSRRSRRLAFTFFCKCVTWLIRICGMSAYHLFGQIGDVTHSCM